jgi:hypothetical protein
MDLVRASHDNWRESCGESSARASAADGLAHDLALLRSIIHFHSRAAPAHDCLLAKLGLIEIIDNSLQINHSTTFLRKVWLLLEEISFRIV